MLILCGFFFSQSVFAEFFKNISFEKPLKISLQTRQFLKKTVYCQKQILKADRSQCLMQDLLDINARVLQVAMLAPVDVQDLLNMVDQAKKLLLEQGIMGLKLENNQLINFLIDSLQSVQARTTQHDLRYLQKLVQQPMDFANVARTVGICRDMIRHFDGVLMTEYDLLVLSNLAVALTFQNR